MANRQNVLFYEIGLQAQKLQFSDENGNFLVEIRFLIQFETGHQVKWVQKFEKKIFLKKFWKENLKKFGKEIKKKLKIKNPKEIVKIKEAKVV